MKANQRKMAKLIRARLYGCESYRGWYREHARKEAIKGAERVCEIYLKQDPGFSRMTFLEACGIDCHPNY